MDKSLATKILGSALYHLYQELERVMKDQNIWEEGMRFGSTGSPRYVFLKYPNKDSRILFQALVNDDKSVRLEPDTDELEAIKISRTVLDEAFKVAIANAAKERVGR